MTTYSCTHCQKPLETTTESQRYRQRKTGNIFCLKSCGYAHRDACRAPRLPTAWPTGPCCMCGKPADLSGHRHSQAERTGRAYCSTACSMAYRARVSSQTSSATNRQHASARMRARNPMANPETRERVATTLRTIGHQPVVRGGNGAPLPLAERVLQEMFRPYGFHPQCVVKTGMKRGSGLPPSYKVDAGNPTLRIALEADGPSHQGKRKVLDAKRDACLRGLGWTVLRFSNEEIVTTPWTVLSTTLKSMACTPT